MNTNQMISVTYTNVIYSVAMMEKSVADIDERNLNDKNTIGLKCIFPSGYVLKESDAQTVLELVCRVLTRLVKESDAPSKPSDQIEIDSYILGDYIVIRFNKTPPQLINKPIEAMRAQILGVCRTFYGYVSDIVPRMNIANPGVCDEVINSGLCTNCINKYAPLLAILPGGSENNDSNFVISQKFHQHHIRESQSGPEDKIILAVKWEKYLLGLLFKMKGVELVGDSDMLNISHIPKMISEPAIRLKAAKVIQNWNFYPMYSPTLKVKTMRKYRELIIKYHVR